MNQGETTAALLHLALDAGNAVGWDWDLKTGSHLWFGDLNTMFGIASPTFAGRVEDFRARVHHDDRDAMTAAVTDALRRRAPYAGVFRVITIDGRVRWVSARGEFVFAPDGAAERMLGIGIDITAHRETEQTLRERERALAEAQRLARLGSWEWERITDTVRWSDELYRLAERDPSGPAVSFADHPTIYTPESWNRLRAAVEEACRSGSPYELDLEMVLPGGGTRWLLARGEALRDGAGKVVKLRGTVQDITERRRGEQALALLGRRLIESQEAERVRIARELHDDVGQRIALLTASVDRFRQSGKGSYDDLRAQLLDLQKIVGSLSHELHATPLRHLGLVRAVRGYCSEVASVHRVDVKVCETGDLKGIGSDVELCLFRVLQESLRNAIRHSGVTQFAVELSGEPDTVSLTVRDEGSGFDPRASTSGLGLLSMRERLKLVNGELVIDSASAGTVVRARVPRASPVPQLER